MELVSRWPLRLHVGFEMAHEVKGLALISCVCLPCMCLYPIDMTYYGAEFFKGKTMHLRTISSHTYGNLPMDSHLNGSFSCTGDALAMGSPLINLRICQSAAGAILFKVLVKSCAR